MSATRKAVFTTSAAALIATAIGAGLYTAPDAPTARTTIGAGTSSYVDPLTTNGDILVREGGATTRRAIGATEGHVLTVTSGLPQWVAPAVTNAAIDCDGDSPAWTDTAGGGTAVFTGGTATFTSPSGVSVARADGARSTVALSALGVADPWRLRMEARLLTYDASGQRRAVVGMSSKASIADADYVTGDFGVFALILNAGELTIYDFVGATFGLRQTSDITLALDGDDWLALEVRGPYLTLLHGRGSARPTSWVIAATAVWAGGPSGARAVPPAYALLGGYRTDTTASVFTAQWSGVRVTDLP